MSDLEVEAVDALPTAPDAPRYVLYGGKGGVGKTTMAAATALASAEADTPTLVVSTDPAHSLADALGTDVPPEPGRLRDDVPLYGVEIDPEAALQDAAVFGGDGALGGPLEGLLGDDAPGGGMPGADEAAAVQLLVRFLDDERFDRVVVDTAPTGHTLRLLELPEAMDSLLGRLVRLREQVGGLLGGVPGLGDDGGADEPDLDEVRRRIERLRAVLRDPERTDFRVVLVPEQLSVRESARLLERLDAYGVPVGTVVVNRVMEDVADVAGADLGDVVQPDRENCAFCRRRWDVQREALAAASDLFRGHDVKRVPLLADEVHGERSLRLVAACLRQD